MLQAEAIVPLGHVTSIEQRNVCEPRATNKADPAAHLIQLDTAAMELDPFEDSHAAAEVRAARAPQIVAGKSKRSREFGEALEDSGLISH